MAAIASTARAARGNPATLASATAAPATTARFAPETARRWLRPAALKSALTCSSIRDTSPTTRPGNSPRCVGGNTSAASRNPDLSAPAARCSQEGPLSTRGAPLTSTTAASSSPGSARPKRPLTSTRWLGSRDRHPAPETNSTTGARSATLPAPVPTDSTRAGTTKLSRGKGPPLRFVSRGSSVTTTSAIAEAFLPASSATGPVPTACTRKATDPATAAAHPRTAIAAFRRVAAPCARVRTATVRAPVAMRPAVTAPVAAEQPSRTSAVIHETAAGRTRCAACARHPFPEPPRIPGPSDPPACAEPPEPPAVANRVTTVLATEVSNTGSVPHLGVLPVTYPAHVAKLLDGAEAAVRVAVFDDAPGEHLAHAR